ncbi:LuxS/MPP-like metallohydrolase [Ganoderma leucocontextum]|nr:LuxS/MPP-like metallohydrolase [Ganoderma leucocontextum]
MSSWKHIPAARAVPAYRLFTGDLEKPSLDDRQYRVLELQNGLRVVVIHDLEADKAAACLALAIGNMYDPNDAQGMAHYCEHMIMKGSEPYPDEGDFASFINANGGAKNGVTGPMSTHYFFSMNPSQLEGGLSRLAAFFHAPLFTESLAAREINAVDSEFKRNLQNDVRRLLQIKKHLGLPGHPIRNFGTGNYVSLTDMGRKGIPDEDEATVLLETRRRVVEWWEQQYCAGRMVLAVIGKEPLESLTSLVVPIFSKIENRGYEPNPAVKEPFWGPEPNGTVVFVETVKDFYAFDLEFELPDLRAYANSKPSSFLGHLFGHEGHGSIYAYLKKQGWLLGLSASASGHTRGPQTFTVGGSLTLEGYLHYDAVLETVFEYISFLRRSFPLPDYHYDEVATMAETRFRFMPKEQPHTYAVKLARVASEPYPPECLISGPCLYRDRDDAMARQLLKGFTPERARVFLQAKVHREEVVGKDIQWETEKWYGTQYAILKTDETLLERLRKANGNPEMALPLVNQFIPTDLSVDKVEVAEPAKYSILVKRTHISQLWHKKDDQFWMPKAHVNIFVKSPLAYVTPRHALLTRLLVDHIEDALAEITYDASLAGLHYSISNSVEGINVGVAGYHDKLDVLLRIVLDKLRHLVVLPDRLRVLKEKLKREYDNFYLGQPSNLANSFATWYLRPRVWTPAMKLTELSSITEAEIECHRDALLSKVSIDMLVTGNFTRERSLEFLSLTEECLKSRPLLPSEIPHLRSLILPQGSNITTRKRLANAKEVNSALSYFCQFGESSDIKLRNIAALLHQLIREPCFTQLRTKEQLGYVVIIITWSVAHSTHGLGIRMQSTRAPWHCEARVEAFLEAFAARLAGLSDAEFAMHKDGLVVKKLERAKNLGEETTRFWDRIRAGHCDFLRHEKDAEAIRALTLAEVVEAYNTLVRPSTGARTRRKLSVQLVSQQLQEDVPSSAFASVDAKEAAPAAPVQLFLDTQEVLGVLDGRADEQESAFKARLGCAPATTPVVSAAFGEYAGAFEIGSPSGRAIGDETGGRPETRDSAGADDTAVASPRL